MPVNTPPERLISALRTVRIPWQRVEPLSGDVSSRRYFRVWCEETTVIACLYPAPFEASEPARQRWLRLCAEDEALRLGFASDPVAFLETTAWLAGARIPVPRIRGVDGAAGCIITDDAGDRSLESVFPAMNAQEAAGVYEVAMDYVARLQRTTADACRQGLVACALRLDEEKLGHELGFLGRVAARFCPDLPMSMRDALGTEWSIIARTAACPGMVLCHRDYHARNLFLRGDTLVVLDHQDLRLGSPHYDVASLLWDPYVDIPRELRDRMLDSAGLACDPSMAAVVWQRLLKALGTYLNVLLVRPSGTFVASALRVVRALRELGPLMHTPITATADVLREVERCIHVRLECIGAGGDDCANRVNRQGVDDGGYAQESR